MEDNIKFIFQYGFLLGAIFSCVPFFVGFALRSALSIYKNLTK